MIVGGHSLLEWHFLRYYNATFSDYFYGLVRAVNHKKNNVQSLSPNHSKKPSSLQKLILLFLVVWMPYIKQKLDRSFQQLKRKYNTNNNNNLNINDDINNHNNSDNNNNNNDKIVSLKQCTIQLFLKIYPALHFFYSSSFIAFQIAFMHDHTNNFSLNDWLSNLISTRLSPLEAATREDKLDQMRATRRNAITIRKPIWSTLLIFYDIFETILDTTKMIIPPT